MKSLFFWRKPGDGEGDRGRPDDGADSAQLLTGDPVADLQSISILLESIAEVNSNIDLEAVLEDIVDKSVAVSHAERGLLLLGDGSGSADDADRLEIRVARDKHGADLGKRLSFSKTLVTGCLKSGHAEKSVVQSDQEALEIGQSVYNLKLRAVMCAPLRVRDRTLGAIYVDTTVVRREFSSRDLALFGALSTQLASALENARLHADSLEKARMQKDFEIAKQIQQHLLPRVPQDTPGVQIAVHFSPRDEASGDTYDIMPLRDGRLVTLVGDVTGHGVGAALLTHAVQAATRSYFELIDDLSEVATRLNERLVKSVEPGNFMSMLLVLIDPARRELHFVNAGHPRLILVRNGRATEFEDAEAGMALGFVEGRHYATVGPIPLEIGDVLFLRTDGVDETFSPDREMFGRDRLLESLAATASEKPARILAEVERAAVEFARGVQQDDDLTMMALKIVES